MNARSLTEGRFPAGNFMHSDVSFDGKRVYFAFCEAERSPERWRDPATMDRYYHVYEMPAGGGSVRKLTEGRYDHFNPTCLPDGRMMLVSTRRGGYHRCGGGPCYVYTLTLMEPGGSSGAASDEAIYPVSFHETNEWDPTILNNGRILYTPGTTSTATPFSIRTFGRSVRTGRTCGSTSATTRSLRTAFGNPARFRARRRLLRSPDRTMV